MRVAQLIRLRCAFDPMMKNILIILLLISMNGCISFKTPYEKFVLSLDIILFTAKRDKRTIEKLSTYTHFLDEKSFVKSLSINSEFYRNHYRKERLRGDFCYYYFIVDKNTNIPVSWGFDKNNSDFSRSKCVVAG